MNKLLLFKLATLIFQTFVNCPKMSTGMLILAFSYLKGTIHVLI